MSVYEDIKIIFNEVNSKYNNRNIFVTIENNNQEYISIRDNVNKEKVLFKFPYEGPFEGELYEKYSKGFYTKFNELQVRRNANTITVLLKVKEHRSNLMTTVSFIKVKKHIKYFN